MKKEACKWDTMHNMQETVALGMQWHVEGCWTLPTLQLGMYHLYWHINCQSCKLKDKEVQNLKKNISELELKLQELNRAWKTNNKRITDLEDRLDREKKLRKRVERNLIHLHETDTKSSSSSSSDSEDDSEYECSTGSRWRKKKKDKTGCQNSKQEKTRDDRHQEKPERQLVKRNQLSSKGAEKNGPKLVDVKNHTLFRGYC